MPAALEISVTLDTYFAVVLRGTRRTRSKIRVLPSLRVRHDFQTLITSDGGACGASPGFPGDQVTGARFCHIWVHGVIRWSKLACTGAKGPRCHRRCTRVSSEWLTCSVRCEAPNGSVAS